MRSAPAHFDPHDLGAAGFAGQPFASIHAKFFLKRSRISVRIAIIAKAATLAVQEARENWPEDKAIVGTSITLFAICAIAIGVMLKSLIVLFS